MPVIVTCAPTAPEAGDRLEIVGVATTVNDSPLLATLFTLTMTLPVVAPEGTVALIEVLPQLVNDVAAVPLKVTVLLPCDVPKFVPVIVTEVPTVPDVGERPVMFGVARTVNETPFVETPLAVTTMFPVVAPVGTSATMDVALQLVIEVADVPLNFTPPVPCEDPKFVPVIVTEVPTAPELGERLVIVGIESTVNGTLFVETPLAVTTTFPVLAPVGTTATIDVAFQELIEVAAVPLNFTPPVPCDTPKFVPVIVTDAPTAAEVGARLVMVGVARTVKETPLVETPLAVTTTFTVVAPDWTTTTIDVALQLVIEEAAVPLNLTPPAPCDEPKLVPVIVTDAPTAPDVGETLVSVGVARTVKDSPLLAVLLTVTMTFPVVAPDGTIATIDVLLQLVIEVTEVPLNFTVLEPCEEPKLVPVSVTDAPTAAEVGARLDIVGDAASTTTGADPMARDTRNMDNRKVQNFARII